MRDRVVAAVAGLLGPEDNAATFADAVQALEQHHMVAVFPEGTTHDDPSIRPLRTGVARIALQAAGAGVEGVQILPVGVTYEDKVAVRGRAIVSYGQPIEVSASPDLVDEHGVPHEHLVRDLTDRLQRAIESLTPHFETTEEALALAAAASISLQPDRPRATPVPLTEVTSRARHLAAASSAERRELVSLVARYRMLLGFVNLDDDDVVRRVGLAHFARRIAVLSVVVALLAPMATAGLLANLVPAVLVLVAVPLLGALALFLLERLRALFLSIVRWRTLLDRRGQLDEVRVRRNDVIDLTVELLAERR